MASVLGAFRGWFSTQPLAVRRIAVKERLDAYLNDPFVSDLRDACPTAVRLAFDSFREAVNTADWTVKQ
jgi:hypothetical protein